MDPSRLPDPSTERSADVAIIGAGPIGLEMAVALKRARIPYLHFDAKQVGHTISWFAPGTRFFSSNERIAIAGVPLQTSDQGKSTREEYLAYLRSVVQQFDLRVNTYEPVLGIERLPQDAGFRLTTRPPGGVDRTYRCRTLVLCTGGTDHPRRLNVPGEDLPHVSHYFRDPHQYFRKRLLIVGGKNSAVEAALRCHHAGAHVSLSYRRGGLPARSIKYWLLPEINGLIKSGRIPAYMGTAPTEITPTQVTLKRSEVSDQRSEERDAPLLPNLTSDIRPLTPVDADFVLLLIGYLQDNKLFKLAGLELSPDCGAPLYDERTMRTSVPGVYVAGTAVGGTQEKYTVFIENCHVHVERVVAALTGAAAPAAPAPIAAPES